MTMKIVVSKAAEINPRIPRELSDDVGRTVSFLPMSQLSEFGYLKDGEERPLGEVIRGYTYFENGDVLIAKITPCMENGKAAYVENLPVASVSVQPNFTYFALASTSWEIPVLYGLESILPPCGRRKNDRLSGTEARAGQVLRPF